jgi:hypothetical protein
MKIKEILNDQTLRDIRSGIISRVIANDYHLNEDEQYFFDNWTEEQYCGAISACRCFFRHIDILKEIAGCLSNDLITKAAAYIALYSFNRNIETPPDSIEAWGKKFFLQNTEFVDMYPAEAKEDIQKYWLLGDNDLFAGGWLFTCSYIVRQVVRFDEDDESNVLPIVVNYFYWLVEDFTKNSVELYEYSLFWRVMGIFIRSEVDYLDRYSKDKLLELDCKEHFWKECGINDGIIGKWRKRFNCFQDKETAIQVIKSEQMCRYYD